jgi:hypothetical protein
MDLMDITLNEPKRILNGTAGLKAVRVLRVLML